MVAEFDGSLKADLLNQPGPLAKADVCPLAACPVYHAHFFGKLSVSEVELNRPEVGLAVGRREESDGEPDPALIPSPIAALLCGRSSSGAWLSSLTSRIATSSLE